MLLCICALCICINLAVSSCFLYSLLLIQVMRMCVSVCTSVCNCACTHGPCRCPGAPSSRWSRAKTRLRNCAREYQTDKFTQDDVDCEDTDMFSCIYTRTHKYAYVYTYRFSKIYILTPTEIDPHTQKQSHTHSCGPAVFRSYFCTGSSALVLQSFAQMVVVMITRARTIAINQVSLCL